MHRCTDALPPTWTVALQNKKRDCAAGCKAFYECWDSSTGSARTHRPQHLSQCINGGTQSACGDFFLPPAFPASVAVCVSCVMSTFCVQNMFKVQFEDPKKKELL